MGYTHYLRPTRTLTKTEWSRFLGLAKHIIEHAPCALAGPIGTGKPELTDETVAFNGDQKREEDYETCSVQRAPWGSFNFCKTARRPYDPVVGAVYLAYQSIHGGDILESDGDVNGEEWAAARAAFQAAEEV